MGTVLGFFLAFTNVYIGLKTGWFLGVNLTACILTYAIWSSLQRAGLVKGRLSILETHLRRVDRVVRRIRDGLPHDHRRCPRCCSSRSRQDTPGGTNMRWPRRGDVDLLPRRARGRARDPDEALR